RSQAGHDLGVFVGRQNLRIPVGSAHHRLRLWLLPPEGHPAARTAHERGGFSAAPGGGSVLLAAHPDSIIAGASGGTCNGKSFRRIADGDSVAEKAVPTSGRRRRFGGGGSGTKQTGEIAAVRRWGTQNQPREYRRRRSHRTRLLQGMDQ